MFQLESKVKNMNEVIATDQLKQFIEQIEKLEEEKAALLENIKDIYDEAKSQGFDTKIMKQIIRMMKIDKDKLAEHDAILDLYREALGL